MAFGSEVVVRGAGQRDAGLRGTEPGDAKLRVTSYRGDDQRGARLRVAGFGVRTELAKEALGRKALGSGVLSSESLVREALG